MGNQTKCRRCFCRCIARDIEHALNTNTSIGNRHRKMADFVNESGSKHGTVEFTAALKHQLSHFEPARELLKGGTKINFLLATKQIGNAGRLKMSQVIVPYAIRHQDNNMIATHLVLLKAEDAFGIGAYRQPFSHFIGNMIPANEGFRRSR